MNRLQERRTRLIKQEQKILDLKKKLYVNVGHQKDLIHYTSVYDLVELNNELIDLYTELENVNKQIRQFTIRQPWKRYVPE